MSWIVIARKDFEDAVRSKTLWVITVLFVVFTAGGLYGIQLAFEDLSANAAVRFLDVPAGLIVPLAAIVVAYLSIAGERESGSIKLLLGLPHSRLDLVLGKLVGRTAVVAVATVVAFASAAVVLVVYYGTFPVVKLLLMGLLTFLLGLVFVAIAIGLSAMTAKRSRAMAGAIGLFFLFELLWSIVTTGIALLFDLGTSGGKFPAWYYLLQRLNPKNAYGIAAKIVAPMNKDYAITSNGSGNEAQQTTEAAKSMADTVIGGHVPFYLDNWFAFVILALWLVLPLAFGYWRFKRVDVS
ncbi:ABC transporter permease subunit [Haladaptatus sp. AB643]|uniref:ABC transporter permease subunit n=1 Tax=Haladaptatus sp. AB643 TaxID=2934174 RepID=UPI00209C42A1|nr:ABC transporter permease subunit [Haladaptatus sp. AB643]MCO8244440.1 ABC transporter permease [Haladaptatus sp. AB643]